MTTSVNQAWNLESLLDSFILELDKAQETLSVKGVTRRLTYTVKDVSLDLHIFPQYHKGKLRFTTAKPGETGASKLSLQLGSITDRQIKEIAKEPASIDDITIEEVEGIDDDVKDSLRKVGVTSARDIQRMEDRNVDLESVVKEKAGDAVKVNYGYLADLINKARRKRLAPSVSRVSMARSAGQERMLLEGDHLVLSEAFEGFPMALVNDEPVDVVSADDRRVQLLVPSLAIREGTNRLKIALDPYAVMTLEINA